MKIKIKALKSFRFRLLTSEIAEFKEGKTYVIDSRELSDMVNGEAKVLSEDDKAEISNAVLRDDDGNIYDNSFGSFENKAIEPDYKTGRPRGRPPKGE